MSTDNCCDDCGDLALPVGDQGEPGLPAFLALPATGGGAPFTNNTNAWVEVPGSRFYFSNTIATPFTSININIWVSAGTGGYRIKDLISGNVLYTNAAVTSTSVTNIESATGLSIYNVANALICVQAISDSAAKTINVGTVTIAYL